MVLVGSATLPGSRYGTLNQDHVLTDVLFTAEELQRLEAPQLYIAIVLDGHGMLGEVAAQHAGNVIIEHIRTSILRSRTLQSLEQQEIERIFTDAFHAAHEVVLQHYQEAPSVYIYPRAHAEERRYTLGKHLGHSVYRHPITGPRLLEFGTTATAVLVQNNTLAIAYVGDSQVVLGRECGRHGYEAQILTEKHSCQHPEERERVRKICGEKAKIKEDDGYLQVPCLPGTSTAFSLAMTRAIGHRMMSEFGVTPTPEVTLRTLTQHDVCIIVASDGVWEGMGPSEAVDEVCDAIAKGCTADAAAFCLCKNAVRAVRSTHRHSMPDNTTAAVLIFDEVEVEEEEEEGGGEMAGDKGTLAGSGNGGEQMEET